MSDRLDELMADPMVEAIAKKAYTAGVKAATEQCIRDVCSACREGSPLHADEAGGYPYHELGSGEIYYCPANPIRRRVANEGVTTPEAGEEGPADEG